MTDKTRSVSLGSYLALAFAVVFFSGLLQSGEWYGVFDFTTLNGSFGTMVQSVSENGDGIKTAMTDMRGKGATALAMAFCLP